jgi:hypothetical protein
MTKRPEEPVATLALSLIDLRAHFEAQLRTVTRAEQCLLKCRGATETAAFEIAVQTLRCEIQVISQNNRSIRTVIDQVDADADALTFAG